jgi:hypothetical protein
MYANPILLPEQTNREDLLRTVSLFDDDTGQAIDVSGRTLAAAGDFVGNVWVVTCGTIITASVSQLTIKDYPIQAEMQALALNVGVGLAILAGSPGDDFRRDRQEHHDRVCHKLRARSPARWCARSGSPSSSKFEGLSTRTTAVTVRPPRSDRTGGCAADLGAARQRDFAC